MTCTKRYTCDLCRDDIKTPVDGIGIRWQSGGKIARVHVIESEHHLCNECVAGLRAMLAAMDGVGKAA